MAHIRAFLPFDNTDVPNRLLRDGGGGDLRYTASFAGTELLFFGAFNYPGRVLDDDGTVLFPGQWLGRIETVTGLEDDVMLFNIRGLNVSPLFLNGAFPIDRAVTEAFSGDDRFIGSRGGDDVSGYDGDDRLQGRTGFDTLEGAAGNDRLSGGRGGDRLKGGRGEDTLKGNEGRDILVGGKGDDVLKGGRGRDVIAFREGDGDDVVRSFQNGRDRVEFRGRDAPDGFGDLRIRQDGRDVLIRYGDEGDSIRLQRTDVDDVTADDFLF